MMTVCRAFDVHLWRHETDWFSQGGAVATSGLTLKESSPEATWKCWMRNNRSHRPRLQVMEICRCKSAKVDRRVRQVRRPMIPNRISSSKGAKSLARNWAMPVCVTSSFYLLCWLNLTAIIAIFGAGATVGSNIVNSIF